MNTKEILHRVQFIVDAEGHQSGVLLSIKDWEELLSILEDLEDAEEIRRSRDENEENILWEQAKVELGIDV